MCYSVGLDNCALAAQREFCNTLPFKSGRKSGHAGITHAGAPGVEAVTMDARNEVAHQPAPRGGRQKKRAGRADTGARSTFAKNVKCDPNPTPDVELLPFRKARRSKQNQYQAQIDLSQKPKTRH